MDQATEAAGAKARATEGECCPVKGRSSKAAQTTRSAGAGQVVGEVQRARCRPESSGAVSRLVRLATGQQHDGGVRVMLSQWVAAVGMAEREGVGRGRTRSWHGWWWEKGWKWWAVAVWPG